MTQAEFFLHAEVVDFDPRTEPDKLRGRPAGFYIQLGKTDGFYTYSGSSDEVVSYWSDTNTPYIYNARAEASLRRLAAETAADEATRLPGHSPVEVIDAMTRFVAGMGQRTSDIEEETDDA